MSNNSYLPPGDSERSAWLKNFAGKLPLYASTFTLLPAEITAATGDSLMVVYALDQVGSYKKETAKRVAYKNELFNGEIGSTLGAYPVTGTSPAAPATVAAGVFKRTAKFVQRIKNHANYTSAIGEDLGIEAHDTLRSGVILQPALKVTLDAEHPVIKWKKGNTTAADLYVDRNDGRGRLFLATATVPHYTDVFELPAGNTTGLWTYVAIYKDGDDQTGVFSNPVTIAISRTV